ncbi:MAG: DUF6503 family protein [Owenweeksia sp.]
MRFIFSTIFLFTLYACQPTETSGGFVPDMEKAHQKELFLKQEAVQFDIELNFNGKERLKGTVTLQTNSRKGRIDTRDGQVVMYDNGVVYYSPEYGEAGKANFDAYTWSYFFLMPYKLSDPGTNWANYSDKELQGKMYDVQKLTFDEGVGGSPEDWYIVYRDPKTKLLYSAAYIVTANKSVKEAEKDPHAIEYLQYEYVDGVPFSKRWNFWAWKPGQGLTKKLGEAQLSLVRFTQLNEDFFEPLPGMLKTRQ